MSSLSLRLPESLHQRLRELAGREDISINQFIATAVAEKAAALLTVEYLEARAQRANGMLFDRVLSRVPDVPPIEGDEFVLELAVAATCAVIVTHNTNDFKGASRFGTLVIRPGKFSMLLKGDA